MDEKNGIRNANRKAAVYENESSLAQEVKMFCENILNICGIEDGRKCFPY